jgi:hypothetical protein
MSSPCKLPICAGRFHLGGTMALSGAAAQAAAFNRDARSQAQQNRATAERRLAAVVAMAIVVVMAAMVTHPRGPAFAAHCQTASLADLRRFRLHASGNLRYVRNNIGTKPHGIRGACLPDSITALGGRAVDTTKEDGREHDKRAGQVNDPHDDSPG